MNAWKAQGVKLGRSREPSNKYRYFKQERRKECRQTDCTTLVDKQHRITGSKLLKYWQERDQVSYQVRMQGDKLAIARQRSNNLLVRFPALVFARTLAILLHAFSPQTFSNSGLLFALIPSSVAWFRVFLTYSFLACGLLPCFLVFKYSSSFLALFPALLVEWVLAVCLSALLCH